MSAPRQVPGGIILLKQTNTARDYARRTTPTALLTPYSVLPNPLILVLWFLSRVSSHLFGSPSHRFAPLYRLCAWSVMWIFLCLFAALSHFTRFPDATNTRHRLVCVPRCGCAALCCVLSSSRAAAPSRHAITRCSTASVAVCSLQFALPVPVLCCECGRLQCIAMP